MRVAHRGPTTPRWVVAIVIVVFAVVAAAVGAGVLIRGTTSSHGDGVTGARPSAGGSTSGTPSPIDHELGLHSDELAPFLLVRDDVPARLSDGGYSVWSATDLTDMMTVSAARLQAAGFVDGYGTFFQRNWLGSGPKVDLVSLALLFEDGRGATAGFDAMNQAMEASERSAPWRMTPVWGLGDGGVRSVGIVDGFPTIVYLWVVDDVVLVVASQGEPRALSVLTMAGFAQTMDRRAAPTAPRGR